MPFCMDRLMEGLGELQKKYTLPVQSHLSENPDEIAWVKELCPWSEFYGDAYDHFGLFGGECPEVMAHCVYSGEAEIRRMKEKCGQNMSEGKNCFFRDTRYRLNHQELYKIEYKRHNDNYYRNYTCVLQKSMIY